ncbi:MAG: hypothetical protein ACQESD_00480 [Thermoplasmatota archaeon]
MSCVEELEGHGDHVSRESKDFIQSHVDSFFPLDEEVIEEENESKDEILTKKTGDVPYEAKTVTERVFSLGIHEDYQKSF